MKIEYRLLCDIMAKTISVKAGSFNAITTEKFLMLTEIVCGVRINWTSVLFKIFKKMVTPGTKQAKGFAMQVSLLLENILNLEQDESSEFPSSKILTERTIHRYIVLNDKVGAEEAADAPKVKKGTFLKKKRTMKKKSGSSQANLEIVAVAQEAVPIQIIEPIPATPADDEMEEQPADEPIPAAPADDEMEEQPADEVAGETIVKEFDEPAVETTAEEIRTTSADDVDIITKQVIADTAQMGPDAEDHGVGAPDIEDQPAGTTVGEKQWFDLPNEYIFAQMDADRPVVTPSDTDEEMETIGAGTGVGDQQLHCFVTADSRTVAAADYFVEEVEMSDDEQSVDESIDADESMSLEDILLSIPVDVPLPSAGVDITKIILGKDIKIPGVDERTWYLASLPQIPVDDKGKEPLMEKDPVKGNPVKEQFLLILADIECLVQLREKVIDEVVFYSFSFKKLAELQIYDSYFVKLVSSWAEAESTGVALQRRKYILLKYRELLIRKFLEARQMNFAPGDVSMADDTTRFSNSLADLQILLSERIDGRNLDDFQTLRFNEFKKGFLAHSAAVTADSMDFRKEFRALNAKVTYLDEQVAATRNDLLEFRAQVQENLNHIADQLSELIAYINRGGNDKKGGVSSSRPQPPPDDQNRGSGNAGGGGDNVRTTNIVDRYSGSMSREGHSRGRSGGRRGSGSRSGSYKRKHPSSADGPFKRSFEDWLG
ncbi:hypothetical protein F511_11815 [Dorcoceras hygrometricum]|uniref:Splicing factor 3B subunit 1-like n=1 Tax=Dorcoceras hygrometricum TaxID=472368 RepID=A0A2Z7D7Q8_9LAMI|nr:hypothetical protein F511_11815 [Dorcoceras hygrometricum]